MQNVKDEKILDEVQPVHFSHFLSLLHTFLFFPSTKQEIYLSPCLAAPRLE